MGIRRKAREAVLQMLYQMDFSKDDSEDIVSTYWKGREVSDELLFFSTDMLKGIVEKMGQIDEEISGNSTNWKLSRMASVDKNILRMAVFELLWRSDIPIKVTINEAVEIAKKFGSADSGAFVNGVLDNIAKDEKIKIAKKETD